MHRLGFGHRDCKPGNVLVDAARPVKLTDFGVALRAGKGSPAGTPLYLAPERWTGSLHPGDRRLRRDRGVLRVPDRPAAVLRGPGWLREQHGRGGAAGPVDPPLQPLIARGMAKDPADRPQSAIAFVAELEAVAAAAYGADWEERGREPARTSAPRPCSRCGRPVGRARAGGRGRSARGGGGPAAAPRRRRVLRRRYRGRGGRRGRAVTAAVTLTGHNQTGLRARPEAAPARPAVHRPGRGDTPGRRLEVHRAGRVHLQRGPCRPPRRDTSATAGRTPPGTGPGAHA